MKTTKTPEEIKKGLECCCGMACGTIKVDCPYEGMRGCHDIVLHDAIAYIKQLEAKVPRWIPVEDEQKPKNHKDVLCRYVFGDSECLYAVLTYYAYGDNGYVTGPHFTGEGLNDMRVTHWMPLPDAPEEVQKNESNY